MFFESYRDHALRGSVDGWGLLHSLTADVLRSVLGSAAASTKEADPQTAKAGNWTVVSSLDTEFNKANLLGENPQKSSNFHCVKICCSPARRSSLHLY